MQFPDYTIYQSYGWGEHRSHFGWIPHRLMATENGQTVAMAQVLARRFPLGVAVAWVPGGPVGLIEAWGEPFRAAIRRAVGVKHLYCRVNPNRKYAEKDFQAIRSIGWDRPHHPLLSGQSILLDIKLSDNDWLSSIDGKHRYYIKKSSGAGLNWAYGNTETLRRDLLTLTRRLSEEKGINFQENDTDSLERLGRSMSGAVHILVGYLDARPVTGCLVLMQGAKAHYAMAATVGRGRDVSAAYCMISNLRSIMREQKLLEFDFGGINPTSDKARGVDHFKRGFGDRSIRYLGEWDWATSSLLRFAANYLIKRRVRGI